VGGRESARVKLIEHGEETYVFFRSQGRRDKEQSMRRLLKKLIKRLRELQRQNVTRDELLLKLGAARKEANKAYALLVIHMPTKDQPHIRNIPLRTGPKEIAAGPVIFGPSSCASGTRLLCWSDKS